MTDREPIEVRNLDSYGSDELPWSRPRDLLAVTPMTADIPFFLGTTGPSGLPHAAGIGAVWFDDTLWFTSGPRTRKSLNLAADPRCTISTRLPGLDLVVEGHASRVTDPQTLEALAEVYRDGGWPAQVDGDAFTAPFSAPSAGPPPWHLYRFTIASAVGVATAEPYGATRWRFAP
jgi:hypothetical protein